MKKGAKKWIAFDFGTNTITSPREGRVISDCLFEEKPATVCAVKQPKDFNLLEKLKPKLIDDLAVHPKKIKEIEIWLQQNVIHSSNKAHSPILLLTGPTGAGKTATVNVLCKIMGIKLAEWVNPVDQSTEMGFYHAQLSKFLDFFTQAKYSSLCEESNSKKLALVEDFPNFVTYNPGEFVGIMEKCYFGNVPVVFICTDSTSSKLDLSKTLFPHEVREKFEITNITFNPCSTSLLKNAVKRAQTIVQLHPDLFHSVNSDVVDAIVSSTMGDVRCAINQFHFSCLKGINKIPLSNNLDKSRVATKRKRNEKPATSIKTMAKDEILGFFHGLGRVLNPKRSELGENSWRLRYDFDSLIDQFATQPAIFSSFLQENYLKYFGDFGDAQRAADILSQAQAFLNNWTERNDIIVYSLWVSVLGLMIFNEHKVSKWNQITAPTKVKQVIDDNLETRFLKKCDYSYYNIINKTSNFHDFKVKK